MKKWLLGCMLFALPHFLQAQVDTLRVAGEKPARTNRFFMEAGATTMQVELGRGYFARFRMGRQRDEGGNFLFSITMMTNTLHEQYTYRDLASHGEPEETGFKTLSGLFYLGPYYEYRFGPYIVMPYLSLGAVVGFQAYSKPCPNLGGCDGGPVLGFEPEMGLQLRPLDSMHIRMGYGTLLAYMYPLGFPEPSGAFSVGLRWLF